MADAAQNTARLVSAANTDNATLVNARPTYVYSISGLNGAAVTYLKLYDKATAPASTDTPRKTYALAANAPFVINGPVPDFFAQGLGYRLVTGSADNDATAVAAGAVLGLNIDWD